MDPSSITLILGSLKSAVDISKSMLQLKAKTDIQASVIELNSKLIEAQQGMFALNEQYTEALNKIRDLQSEIEKFNKWEEEKVRYTLISPWPRHPVLVYHLRKSHSNGENPHWLCPNCYQNNRKSILNTDKKKGEFVNLCCPACKARINTNYNGIDGPQYAEDIEQKQG